MKHSIKQKFLMKELMVGYLYLASCLSRSFLHVITRNMKGNQTHIGNKSHTNKLHRNKLEFTYEFIGNFHVKIGKYIGKLLTTTRQSTIKW
jgi:hypothetical protein